MKTSLQAKTSWLATIGVAAALVACSRTPSNPIAEAELQIKAGRFTEAIPLLKTAAQQLPDEWRVHNLLGRAYHGAGSLDQAKVAYEKAIALYPRNPTGPNTAQFNLGLLLLKQDKAKAASLMLGAFWVGNPGSIETRYWLAQSQFRLGLFAEAETHLQATLKAKPNSAEVFSLLGHAQIQQGKWVDSITSFDAAHRAGNPHPAALLNSAILRHQFFLASKSTQEKDWRVVIDRYEQYAALKPTPSDAERVGLLAKQLAAATRPAVATNNPPVVVANTNRPPFVITNALPPLAETNFIVTVPVIPINPNRPPVVTNIVIKPTLTNTPPVVISPKTPRTNQVASITPKSGTNTIPPVTLPSIERYKYVRPGAPTDGDRDSAKVHFEKALYAYKLKRFDEATTLFQLAAKADGGYFEAQQYHGLSLYSGGKPKASLESFETALAINPLSMDARYNFSLGLHQSGYHIDSAQELEKLLETYPNMIQAHLMLGNIYASHIKTPLLARPHYQKVLALNPQHEYGGEIRRWIQQNP
ncbi:MAG: tetratricopeptide repeat protein [Pedosphaera sp.]|nr:tetratricopeptide repeat protein [Pedosphaera sp.]